MSWVTKNKDKKKEKTDKKEDKAKSKDKAKKEKDKNKKGDKPKTPRDPVSVTSSTGSGSASGPSLVPKSVQFRASTDSSSPITPSALIPKGAVKPRADPNAPKIFGDGGATFAVLLEYERAKHPELHIEMPLVISRCLDFLMYKGLNAEGLFRVPGSKDTLDYYISEFNAGRGDAIDFLKKDELPENVASLLKQYLREMPDIPLFTNQLGDDFCAIISLPNEVDRINKYRELAAQLPTVNQVVIKKLLFYLMQVSSNASTNKMSTDALSIVFGQMAGVFAKNAYELVKWLIDKYPVVYEEAELAVATSPVFLRKLVGHFRSVIKLAKEGNHMFSFDTTGNVRIWDAVNFQYFRSFDTSIKYCKKPVILNNRIYFLDQPSKSLKVWKIEDCVNPSIDVNSLHPETISVGLELSSVLVVVGNQIWVGGENIVIVNEDGSLKTVGVADARNIYNSLTVVGNKVWGLKGKNIHIFDIATQDLEHDLAGKFKNNGNPQDVLPLSNCVWISGRIAAKGCIWVMNTETYEIIGELDKHNSEVYMCQDIGPLVWSVSWDKMIYTWRPQDQQFVAPIKNFHTDAIQAILSVPRPQGDGWIVWTASSDATINVLFVPSRYAEALISEAKLTPLQIQEPAPVTREPSVPSLPSPPSQPEISVVESDPVEVAPITQHIAIPNEVVLEVNQEPPVQLHDDSNVLDGNTDHRTTASSTETEPTEESKNDESHSNPTETETESTSTVEPTHESTQAASEAEVTDESPVQPEDVSTGQEAANVATEIAVEEPEVSQPQEVVQVEEVSQPQELGQVNEENPDTETKAEPEIAVDSTPEQQDDGLI